MGNYALKIGDIIDDTLRVLKDFRGAGLDGFRWSRSDVLYAVKQIYLDLARETHTIFNTIDIAFVEGTYIYDLPADCIYPTRIGLTSTTNGTFYIILPRSITEDVDMTSLLIPSEGLPNWFYRDSLDFNQIGVIPTPGAASGTDYILDITYVRTPSGLVDEGDYPDSGLPEFLQKDFKYGAAALLLSMTSDKGLVYKSRVFMGKWLGRVNMVKDNQLSPTVREGAVPI